MNTFFTKMLTGIIEDLGVAIVVWLMFKFIFQYPFPFIQVYAAVALIGIIGVHISVNWKRGQK